MNRYVVGVYDRYGRVSETTCVDFAHCVEVARILARHHPNEVVRAFNLDRADLDSDGLTDEERDAVAEAIAGEAGS